jgi:tripartite-type tricarboxylate transporter receptor subunit TctC
VPRLIGPACGGALALIGAVAAPLHDAAAQSWPAKTIVAVIPFSAGNANDVVGRIVLDQLSRQLGQTIVVENRAGAGGTTGVNSVAKAAPDGYTLLVHSSSFAASRAIYRTLPYDTLADFTAVVPLGLQPTVLVAAPSKGWKSLADLVAAANTRPGAMNFASAGVGSASHFAAERLRVATRIDAQHIPFKGPNEALTEVMTGRIDFYFLPVAAAISLINDGKVLALAVSTPKRATALPEVPTVTEAGFADAGYQFWDGLFLPAKTPAGIVGKLHQETEKALRVPAVQEKLAKVGVDPLTMSTEQFQIYFRDDVIDTAKFAREAGIPQVD